MEVSQSIDPKSGYCSITKIYHSLRAPISLPPETTPLSITDYILSLLHATPNLSLSSPSVVDATSDTSLSYSSFLRHVDSLASSLSPSIPARHVALILSPPSLHIPVLYFSLLSLNVVVSPANPLSTHSELTHLVSLSKPSVIFTVSSLSANVSSFNVPIIHIDSAEFAAMLTRPSQPCQKVNVSQSDSAVILYSSGTTGRAKGVELTHGNLIAYIAGEYYRRPKLKEERISPQVTLLFIPLFHIFGFAFAVKALAMAETLVIMGRFECEKMLAAVEKYKVTCIPVSPPVLVGMVVNSELTHKYDLSSLEMVRCGGAPIGKEVVQRFKALFPYVEIVQGYAMTETGGGGARALGPEEYECHGSVGRIHELMQAKIIDPSTGEALPHGQHGELWLRGPTIMKGYMGDKGATITTLHPEGWLKTGDLCFLDCNGYLYIVDRIKELIKYKGYQVPPAELEYLLLSHPDIIDAAVIPFPNEAVGEIPMAFVVRKIGSNISSSQVMDYVAKQVTPHKKIRRVAFISSIPKNPSGKILRRKLVKQATTFASKI